MRCNSTRASASAGAIIEGGREAEKVEQGDFTTGTKADVTFAANVRGTNRGKDEANPASPGAKSRAGCAVERLDLKTLVCGERPESALPSTRSTRLNDTKSQT